MRIRSYLLMLKYAIKAINIIILPPKNILLRSITRNMVTEHPKRGLETIPLRIFF